MAKRAALAAFALIVAAAIPVPRAVIAQSAQPTAGQKMAFLTKPAVVRIYDGYIANYRVVNSTFEIPYVGSGSGSIIHGDGYVLTNAHVVDTTQKGEDKAKELLFGLLVQRLARDLDRNPQDSSFISAVSANTQLLGLTHIHHVILPNGDALPFEIKDFGAPVGQGKDVAVVKIEVKNAPTLRLGDSDKVQLQDHVTVFGYPGAADTDSSGILDRKSALEASITDGKLSAKKNSADGAPILQISAPATHGNSGGPVLNDAGEVIGLLTFRGDTVNGQEVSGFAFVVPTSTALEFIKKAGTTANQQSLTDQRYREGLDLYLDGYYSKAIPKLEEVKRLFPAHSEVDKMLTDSQQKIAEGKDRTNIVPWVIGIIVLLVIGVIVIAAVAFLLLRKKKAPALQQPAYAGGPSFPPMQQPSFPPHQQPSFPPQPQNAFPSMPPAPAPAMGGGSSEKTVMVAAIGGGAAAQPGLGTIICTSGALMGQRFEIRPEGLYIGRDGTLSQVVINDNRVSKRHVWVGPRNGRVAVVDQGSTNGTFLNTPGSQRVTEVYLNPGDTVIVSEADVARFQFQR
jgi:V8-like Glu-specific endopeptidase